jgi:hypothetical protein
MREVSMAQSRLTPSLCAAPDQAFNNQRRFDYEKTIAEYFLGSIPVHLICHAIDGG